MNPEHGFCKPSLLGHFLGSLAAPAAVDLNKTENIRLSHVAVGGRRGAAGELANSSPETVVVLRWEFCRPRSLAEAVVADDSGRVLATFRPFPITEPRCFTPSTPYPASRKRGRQL